MPNRNSRTDCGQVRTESKLAPSRVHLGTNAAFWVGRPENSTGAGHDPLRDCRVEPLPNGASDRYASGVDALLEERDAVAEQLEAASERVLAVLGDEPRTLDEIVNEATDETLEQSAVLSAIWQLVSSGQARLSAGLRIRRTLAPG